MKKTNVKHGTSKLPTADAIRESIYAFQKSRVILTGLELGIFTLLDDKVKGSDEIAKQIGADKRATDRLMNALCSLNYLEKNSGKFNNTEVSKKYFVKGKPDYMAGLIHAANQWHSWTTLTEAVTKGTSVMQRAAQINERGGNWIESFIDAMHYRAKKQAAKVIELIDMKGISRVLDVGGGSGAYTIAFVKSKKGVTGTVIDLPNVVPLTQKYIEKEGLSDSISVMEGDYTMGKLPEDYDLVFLSAIVHINSNEENTKLIKKCVKALRKTGMVVIQDHVMDEDRTGPVSSALFALNMLVGTEKGDTFTQSEMASWMIKAGLSDIKRIDTPFGNSLIIGRKR